MKALISITHPERKHNTDHVMVENVNGDDHLWEIVEKLHSDYPKATVRIVWAGITPREYTATEVLSEKKMLG